VAALAGVSRQTVSNVLHERAGYYSAETRSRVLEAVEALNYQPNLAARSLRSRRTRQLGYHMPSDQFSPENAFVLRLIQALVRAAADRGHHVLVFADDDDELRTFRELVAKGSVDGFVLSSVKVGDARARLLAGTGMPFALFGRTGPGLPQTWVDIDNAAAIRQSVDHLVAAGRQRFAYVGFDAGAEWDRQRVEGYRLAMEAHGLAVEEDLVIGCPTMAAVHEGADRLLRSEERPDAIVTSGDVVAATIVNAARSLGLLPGADFGLVGFDGGFVQELTDPVLTSVRIPVEQIAAKLVERLLLELESGPTGGPGEVVATEVVKGGTG
jgi:DNA-binding LacI/PurR family transcriptional regulator